MRLEDIVKFNPLSNTHLKELESMVSPDRFSTGVSILDLHAKDQSAHLACRPERTVTSREWQRPSAYRASS